TPSAQALTGMHVHTVCLSLNPSLCLFSPPSFSLAFPPACTSYLSPFALASLASLSVLRCAIPAIKGGGGHYRRGDALHMRGSVQPDHTHLGNSFRSQVWSDWFVGTKCSC
uniref:Uncharacterized protein n=1 Tax=Poecilia mexicana TaxID=48701 RepID=A0A3B3WX12_9TELE